MAAPDKRVLLSLVDGPEGIEIYESEEQAVVDWASHIPALYLSASINGASVRLGPFNLLKWPPRATPRQDSSPPTLPPGAGVGQGLCGGSTTNPQPGTMSTQPPRATEPQGQERRKHNNPHYQQQVRDRGEYAAADGCLVCAPSSVERRNPYTQSDRMPGGAQQSSGDGFTPSRADQVTCSRPDAGSTDKSVEYSPEQVKHMVERFLTWRLPENFNPDGGISFKAMFNEHTDHPMRHEPVGTNLFDAVQAEAMVRYMLEGLPTPQPTSGTSVPSPGTAIAHCAHCGKEIVDAKAAGVRAYCSYECYCDD